MVIWMHIPTYNVVIFLHDRVNLGGLRRSLVCDWEGLFLP